MTSHRSTSETKVRAAVAMMRLGLATQAEVAELAGESRQLVRHWAMRAGIDATEARRARLAREWASRVNHRTASAD